MSIPSSFSKPVARPRMRVSSLLGRNASCCDSKQLFQRLAGVALHGGTGVINGFQSSPHRVVTANLAHPQQGRIDAIMSQSVDMGIAPTASHNGQQQRAKYIPDLWGVRAAVLQQTVLNIWLEQIGLLQEVDEKGN